MKSYNYLTLLSLLFFIFISCEKDEISGDQSVNNTGKPTFEFITPLEDTLTKGIGDTIKFSFKANSSVSTHQALSRIQILINSHSLMDSTLSDYIYTINIDYDYIVSDTLKGGIKYLIDVVTIDKVGFDGKKSFILWAI